MSHSYYTVSSSKLAALREAKYQKMYGSDCSNGVSREILRRSRSWNRKDRQGPSMALTTQTKNAQQPINSYNVTKSQDAHGGTVSLEESHPNA